MATLKRRPQSGLILHSDRGSQYCAKEYQKWVKQADMIASMSRRGNCYDNAPMESFWGALKNELVYQQTYQTRQKAINDVVEYIEIFYNRMRRHSSLGYIAPAQMLKLFEQKASKLDMVV